MPTRKETSHRKRLNLASYLSNSLSFLGVLILFSLVLSHISNKTVTISHSEKIIFVCLIVLASILLLGGLLLNTTRGIQYLCRTFQVSADDINQIRSQKLYRTWSRVVLLAFFVTIYLAFLDEKMAVFYLDATRYHNDTNEYVRVAIYPFTSVYSWGGIRSIGLPLFYRLVGYNSLNFSDQGFLNHVSQIQLFISIICWSIFAVTTSFAMKNWISRIFIFSIILMFSASVDITFWDHPMLTESLAISSFVLFISLLILAGLLMERSNRIHGWVQGILVGTILIVALFYSLIRDTNIYFLLFLACFMGVGLFFHAIRKSPILPAYIVVAIGFLLIIWLGNTSANIGKRHVPPMLHVFAYRFIPHEESRNFFLSHGMPFDDRIATLDQLSIRELNSNYVTDASIKRLITWLGEDGKRLSMQYLVSHPAYSLFSPLKDIQKIVNGHYVNYRLNLTPTPARIRLLSAIAYLRFEWLPLLFLVLAMLCLGLIFERSNRGRVIWYIVMILFFTAYPLAVIGWHGDTLEIERHSVQVAIQLRLAVWLLVGFWVERGYSLLIKLREAVIKK